MKSQGSNKIKTYCTASLTTTKHKVSGLINVKVCHTHYGHNIQLGHIPLAVITRQEITAQLVAGVTSDNILDKIRNSIGGELKHIHLLTRQDIKNVERMTGTKSIEKHSDDAI